MNELNNKIIEFEQLERELRGKLIVAIKDFVKKHGRQLPKNKKVLCVSLDCELGEYVETVYLTVVVERICDYLGIEALQSIRLHTDKDSEKEFLEFETGSALTCEDDLNVYDLIAVYDQIDYFENSGDIEIVIRDGVVMPVYNSE